MTLSNPFSEKLDSAGATPYELLLLAGLLGSLMAPISGQTALRLACLLGLAPIIYRERAALAREAMRMPLLFLLPALLALSLVWTPRPGAGATFVAMMAVSYFSVVYAVARANFRQIAIIILIAGGIAALASYVSPNVQTIKAGAETAMVGLYAQKNYFGKRMMLVCLVAAYVATTLQFPKPLRWASAALGLFTIPLVIQSNSATALILTLFGLLLILAVLFLGQAARLKAGLPLILVVFAGALALGGYISSYLGLNPVQAILDAFGKDSTLTGRTEIWGYARSYMAEHPLLGAGVEGFWRPQMNEAVWISSVFNEPNTYRFYFHSSFFELGVHVGISGIVALALVELFIAAIAIRDTLVFRDSQAALTLTLVSVIIVRSFTESNFYSKAELNVLLPWIFVGFALKRYAEHKASAAALREPIGAHALPHR